MCKSKGKRLVINLFYHTNISFIISPFSYNIMYPSWLATSYNYAPFMMSMWSYHWQSRYTFASVPLWEWHTIAHNTFWDIVATIVLENKTHVEREVSHLFPCHIRWQVDILIIRNGFHTLMDIVIVDPIHTDMVQWTLMIITHVAMMAG
jgi:hypothetical protein